MVDIKVKVYWFFRCYLIELFGVNFFFLVYLSFFNYYIGVWVKGVSKGILGVVEFFKGLSYIGGYLLDR